MEYNNIIQRILVKFNETFNTNYKIIFNTREFIMNNNQNRSISESACGFYDNETKCIYIFSDIIDKINSKNYDNNNNLYDNGLAFLILSCFHELEHRLQNEHPEKLRLQQDFAQEIYSIERFIILFRNYAPELMEIDYKKFHDNFLLEIDADTKGVNNAIAFSRGNGISSINFKYYELFSQYNNFRIQNYDTLIIINQFLKIANKYKSKAINGNYLPGKILNYFDENGNLKNIDDLMEIQNSSIIQYIVSSPEFLKSINQGELTKEQCEFISNCINDVLNEHYFKKAFTEQNKEQMDSIILELRNYTQISSTNSKTSDSMSNENYYMYLQSKLGSLQAIQFEERKIK